MILDVSHTGNSAHIKFSIPLVDVVKTELLSLMNIKRMIESTDEIVWMDQAIKEVKSEMKSDTKDLIEQTKVEIDKAKNLLKEKHPIRYQLTRYFLNPIKALWLLMLK